MLIASIFAHISLGLLLAIIFVVYYINGDGKWKLWIEIVIGTSGNIGGIFLLDSWLHTEDSTIRMWSVGVCIAAFVIGTLLLLVVLSHAIKDKDDKDIIRLRDIMLGQTSWINKYYECRAKEIDNKLNLPSLIERERKIRLKENDILEKEKYVSEELAKLGKLGVKKLKLNLPENASIVLNNEYVEAMPSYIGDIIRCINDINSCTNMILSKEKGEIDVTTVKSYFISLAAYISSDIFGGVTRDARIHFRIYDIEKKGYVKLVAVIGKNIVKKEMTFIPYDDDSMIKKSYECRRALIKSINSEHDYQSDNHTIWEDYLTYTFYGLTYGNVPFLSFGISIKNAVRYKKVLHFFNYFRIESFLQNCVERIDEYVDLANIFFGGSENGKY